MNEQSFTFVLFGATGDLAGKKILPALFELFRHQKISGDFALIGNSRTQRADQDFKDFVHRQLKTHFKELDQETWQRFSQKIHFVTGDASDKQTILDLFLKIEELKKLGYPCDNLMFHIATLPELYLDILSHLGEHINKTEKCGWRRVLIEKPFGTDLKSAKSLNQLVQRYFSEDELFRIDHFLGKETVQNILAFRFANGLFKPIWNNQFIDNIQITVFESDGVKGREIFYDSTGVIRDVVQNHILQILAVTIMDTPKSLESQDIREMRLKVLQSLKCCTPEEAKDYIVYGQYGAGEIGGQEVGAYTQEENIASSSTTPTYVAIKTQVNSSRAKNIPIYIRSGKRLSEKVTEVSVQFNGPKNVLPQYKSHMTPNILTIRIQPNEGIVLRLDVKKPGYGHTLEPVVMEFCYNTSFSQNPIVDAYERLISDAYEGNRTLFPTSQEVEAAWQFIDPLLQEKTKIKPIIYQAGTHGPKEGEDLLKKDGCEWIEPSPALCRIK